MSFHQYVIPAQNRNEEDPGCDIRTSPFAEFQSRETGLGDSDQH